MKSYRNNQAWKKMLEQKGIVMDEATALTLIRELKFISESTKSIQKDYSDKDKEEYGKELNELWTRSRLYLRLPQIRYLIDGIIDEYIDGNEEEIDEFYEIYEEIKYWEKPGDNLSERYLEIAARMREFNKESFLCGSELMELSLEINYMVVSLDKMSSHYLYSGETGYEKEFARFVYESKVIERLDEMRKVLEE